MAAFESKNKHYMYRQAVQQQEEQPRLQRCILGNGTAEFKIKDKRRHVEERVMSSSQLYVPAYFIISSISIFINHLIFPLAPQPSQETQLITNNLTLRVELNAHARPIIVAELPIIDW